jgi:hypothetical protein
MKLAHKGLRITEADWTIADDLFLAALNKHEVGMQKQSEFMQIIRDMKSQIVEIPGFGKSVNLMPLSVSTVWIL